MESQPTGDQTGPQRFDISSNVSQNWQPRFQSGVDTPKHNNNNSSKDKSPSILLSSSELSPPEHDRTKFQRLDESSGEPSNAGERRRDVGGASSSHRPIQPHDSISMQGDTRLLRAVDTDQETAAQKNRMAVFEREGFGYIPDQECVITYNESPERPVSCQVSPAIVSYSSSPIYYGTKTLELSLQEYNWTTIKCEELERQNLLTVGKRGKVLDLLTEVCRDYPKLPHQLLPWSAKWSSIQMFAVRIPASKVLTALKSGVYSTLGEDSKSVWGGTACNHPGEIYGALNNSDTNMIQLPSLIKSGESIVFGRYPFSTDFNQLPVDRDRSKLDSQVDLVNGKPVRNGPRLWTRQILTVEGMLLNSNKFSQIQTSETFSPMSLTGSYSRAEEALHKHASSQGAWTLTRMGSGYGFGKLQGYLVSLEDPTDVVDNVSVWTVKVTATVKPAGNGYSAKLKDAQGRLLTQPITVSAPETKVLIPNVQPLWTDILNNIKGYILYPWAISRVYDLYSLQVHNPFFRKEVKKYMTLDLNFCHRGRWLTPADVKLPGAVVEIPTFHHYFTAVNLCTTIGIAVGEKTTVPSKDVQNQVETIFHAQVGTSADDILNRVVIPISRVDAYNSVVLTRSSAGKGVDREMVYNNQLAQLSTEERRLQERWGKVSDKTSDGAEKLIGSDKDDNNTDNASSAQLNDNKSSGNKTHNNNPVTSKVPLTTKMMAADTVSFPFNYRPTSTHSNPAVSTDLDQKFRHYFAQPSRQSDAGVYHPTPSREKSKTNALPNQHNEILETESDKGQLCHRTPTSGLKRLTLTGKRGGADNSTASNNNIGPSQVFTLTGVQNENREIGFRGSESGSTVNSEIIVSNNDVSRTTNLPECATYAVEDDLRKQIAGLGTRECPVYINPGATSSEEGTILFDTELSLMELAIDMASTVADGCDDGRASTMSAGSADKKGGSNSNCHNLASGSSYCAADTALRNGRRSTKTSLFTMWTLQSLLEDPRVRFPLELPINLEQPRLRLHHGMPLEPITFDHLCASHFHVDKIFEGASSFKMTVELPKDALKNHRIIFLMQTDANRREVGRIRKTQKPLGVLDSAPVGMGEFTGLVETVQSLRTEVATIRGDLQKNTRFLMDLPGIFPETRWEKKSDGWHLMHKNRCITIWKY